MIRILIVNVHFAPLSFGGATIVAEEVALELAKRGYLPLVVTTINDPALPEYHPVRYHSKGLDVVAVNVPEQLTYEDQYANHRFARIFEELLGLFQPDIAHIHSIQSMGAEMAHRLRARSIPYCITLHDCWWVCERQFMINRDEKYCFQTKIDPSICTYCVDEGDKMLFRSRYLKEVLEAADRLFFPSKFHRDLHIANGVAESRALVNRNGIRFPAAGYVRRQGTESGTTFGFVGGPGPIKGSDVMLEAFNRIERNDYTLYAVDAALNRGMTWSHQISTWEIPGRLVIVDGYSQDTIDEFFRTIDVLLFPSQWKESFGLSVREALARDVWVIATDGGGTVEDISDGENGEIIPLTPDPRPLAEAIARAMDRDWSTYSNPRKQALQSYRGQALELDRAFRELMARQKAS